MGSCRYSCFMLIGAQRAAQEVPKEQEGCAATPQGADEHKTRGIRLFFNQKSVAKVWAMLDLNQRPYGYQPYALTS